MTNPSPPGAVATDRALLEAAARAAGIKGKWGEVPTQFRETWLDENGCEWNPLTDDGDAFRLAVKLGLRISHYPIFDTPKFAVLATERKWSADADRDISNEDIQAYNGDPYAATRRAIVRAAASIGGLT